ncbi:TPA: hypothetical protein N0F65_000848 [Lagenidium giganteum]|uniref:Protein kinase domain-containing protein n=1 Tax=Lagenidium giganteum TaxID=4803 RepID=A0AAV2YZ64_9STRA|nr:TPA: hypothetical protein N0F65_000848 [Lagenidium giganteum]
MMSQVEIVVWKNVGTGKLLEHHQGRSIAALDDGVTDSHRQWYRIRKGNGFFAYKNVATSMVLDHYRSESIQAYDNNIGNYHHQWREEDIGDGRVVISNRGSGMVLDHYNGECIQAEWKSHSKFCALQYSSGKTLGRDSSSFERDQVFSLTGGMEPVMTVGRIAMVVADFVVAPGVMSIANLVIAIGTECANMNESTELCATVRERLDDVLPRLQAMEEDGFLPADLEAVHTYARSLQRFHQALQKHSRMSVIKRVLFNTKFIEELKAVHEEIDMLFHMLNLAHIGSVYAWQLKFDQAQNTQQQLLRESVSNTNEILDELRSFQNQMNSITMLTYELTLRKAQHSDDDLRLLCEMYNKCKSVCPYKLKCIPMWFMAEDEVIYDRTEPFDRGSFGTVYHGKWANTTVVVKTLLPELLQSERDVSAFTKEIKIWHELNHGNVLRMYGACHVSTPPFIICEDATNGRLDHYLYKEENKNKVWRLLHQTAVGLRYVHSRDIVHGDLKCNNILVGADGNARLSDFGLSFVRTRSSVLSSSTNQFRGTGAMRWKAPECLQARRPTFASDVYSFGMCIIEAVTLEVPWPTATDDIVRAAVVQDRSLPEKPECMSEQAWDLIVRMCAYEPQTRILMPEVITVLEGFKRNEESEAGAPVDNENAENGAPDDLSELVSSEQPEVNTEDFAASADKPEAATDAEPAVKIVALKNVGTGLVLEHYQGKVVQAFSDDISRATCHWRRIPVDSGYFAYKNVASGMVLDHYYRRSIQAPYGNPNNHNRHWRELDVGNGRVAIANRVTGMVLDHYRGESIEAFNNDPHHPNHQWTVAII